MFKVYIDGLVRMEVLDNTITASERFYLNSPINSGIDNVTVSNSIDFDAAPPRWIEAPEDQQINAGQSFRYDLNATDSSGIDEWSVDDTTHFSVDSNGVITDIVDLAAGTYDLEVTVNDTLGHIQTGTFRLTVEDVGAILDVALIALGVGVVGIIVVVLVFIKRRA
jgi:hypothetical protein